MNGLISYTKEEILEFLKIYLPNQFNAYGKSYDVLNSSWLKANSKMRL